LTGCGGKKDENNEQKKVSAKVDSIAVVVVSAESKKLSLVKVFTGSIEGEEQANLVSRVSERIVKIPVKVGDNVKADQVLIYLDKKGMSSQYNQALSSLENAEKDLNRMKSLYESGAISQQALDGVQTLYKVASANFDAAKSAVEITSPISGVVTSIKNNVGDFTAPGSPIITVARISGLKLVMSVGEADLPYITQSKNVKIYSELNPSLIADGKISEISRSADIQTRTFEVKAVFPNKSNNFMPGMFARAELELSSHAPITVVPRQAVVYNEEGARVFVITDGKAYSKKIKTGLQNDSEIEVLEGLNAGETVVKIGTNNLRDGIPVVITKENLLSQN
jgi:RND family efflux transporter MFP subunit